MAKAEVRERRSRGGISCTHLKSYKYGFGKYIDGKNTVCENTVWKINDEVEEAARIINLTNHQIKTIPKFACEIVILI